LVFFGIWYQVKKEFSDSIDKDIHELITNPLNINIKYNKDTLLTKYKRKTKSEKYEYWFNSELRDYLNTSGKSALLDTDIIQMEGYDKIEVCDVLYRDKEKNVFLFHNKYNYGSCSLSHLFSQGNVSAQLLTDQSFRKKVNVKIDDENLKFPIDDSYNSKNYTIVYGIIMKPNKKGVFSIPLFSKINLKIFTDSLKAKSYKYKICFFEEE